MKRKKKYCIIEYKKQCIALEKYIENKNDSTLIDFMKSFYKDFDKSCELFLLHG